MAKLRKFVAYRRLEHPYTRKSKYRSKDYIRASPNCKISRHVMGDKSGTFQYRILLTSKEDLQIRDNAIEAARQVVIRRLEKTMGKGGYQFRVRVYPHHFLRENPLASGAGADRMSTGMAAAFGKVIGIAARVFEGQPVFEVLVNKDGLVKAKAALSLARSKLPCSCSMIVEDVVQAQ